MSRFDSGTPPQLREKKDFIYCCFDWAEALIVALISVMVIFLFFFRLNVVVQGKSMEPNYNEGDHIFVNCEDRNYTRGDVVVIDAEGTGLKERIIKRVIATEGQRVRIDSATGYVYVNDQKLDESAYIQNGITKIEPIQLPMKFPLTVPKGKVFVLGDHREVSVDSRYKSVGLIDTRYIIGKVPFLLSPFSTFSKK